MATLNKILLIGNLTRDPQLSYLPSQTPVVEFALAITRKYYVLDKQLKEEVCFIDCKAYGKLAENLNKLTQKGNPLFVEGRLTFDSWTAKDGSKHSKHRVTIENFQLLGKSNTVKADDDVHSVPEEPASSLSEDLNQDI